MGLGEAGGREVNMSKRHRIKISAKLKKLLLLINL